MPKKLRLEILTGLIPKTHDSKEEDVKISIEVDVPSKVFTVGRLSYNDIVLEFRTISLIHARVYVFGRLLFLEDLDSLNGTYHGSFEVGRNRMTLIQSGDQVQMADIQMRIFLDLPPPQKDVDLTATTIQSAGGDFVASDAFLATELETLPCYLRESIAELLSGYPKAFTDSFVGQTPEPPPLPLVKAQPRKKSLQNCPGLIPMKPKEKLFLQEIYETYYANQGLVWPPPAKEPSFSSKISYDEHAVTEKRSLPPLASPPQFSTHPSGSPQAGFAGEIRRYFPWQEVNTPSLPSALLPQSLLLSTQKEVSKGEPVPEKEPKK